MWYRSNRLRSDEGGFTLVELLITFIVVVMVSITFVTLFKTTLTGFLNMQTDASGAVQINTQANRIASVLRGTTGIVSVATNDMVLYSYFYPSDAFVSQLHYYLVTANGQTRLQADLIPMSANPPTGTLITAKKRTFTIIDNYYNAPGVTLFVYLDASGKALSLPITDLQTIKGVQVTLAAKTSNSSNQTMSIQVSLRNRKTNL
ncbi:MAG: hypothetical protein WAQ24_01495 [Candidatus Saccharimonadales bacterium]